MPISKYKSVQTGPKTQSGGLKDGLLRAAYQLGIEGVVKRAPIIPAIWQMMMAETSLPIFPFNPPQAPTPNLDKLFLFIISTKDFTIIAATKFRQGLQSALEVLALGSFLQPPWPLMPPGLDHLEFLDERAPLSPHLT